MHQLLGRPAVLLLAGALLVAGRPACAEIEPGSLRLLRVEDHVVLQWEPIAGPHAIYAAGRPDGVEVPANEIAVTSLPEHTEPIAALPAVAFFLVGVPQGGSLACGPLSCSPGKEYCLIVNPPLPEVPLEYECKPVPAACLPIKDCECLVAEEPDWPGGALDCQQGPEGGFVLSVYLP